MRSAILGGLFAGCAVGACGDAAVDGEYRGEALFTLSGAVATEFGAVTTTDAGELRAALFWARPSGAADASLFESVTAVEQELGAASAFPARYTLTIRRPPPASLLGTSTEVEGRFAIALVLVYLDLDGDARWNHATESLVGSAAGAFILYAPDGLTGGRYGVVRPGFHLLAAAVDGQPCQGMPVQANADNLSILVDMRYPGHALADLDCDGHSDEWSGACPRLEHVVQECRGSEGVRDPEMCAACDGLLWPVGADASACNTWLASCEHIAEPHECEEAVRHCGQTTTH